MDASGTHLETNNDTPGARPATRNGSAPPTTRWDGYVRSLHRRLEALEVTDGSGRELPPGTGFRLWHDWTVRARRQRGTVFLVGNGASASMASHIAADVAKGAGVRTQVFTDPALVTAVANDVSYADVFATPLGWSMREGDVLVAVSSSGSSPNVVRAIERTHELRGLAVTLTAMAPDNAARRAGDVNFWVPAETYGLAETAHAAILHHFVDRLLGA